MITRSQAISKLFQYLEDDGVNYVVVGDTRGYPEEVHGDTDIVTDPRSLPLAQQSLFKFCKDYSIKNCSGITARTLGLVLRPRLV